MTDRKKVIQILEIMMKKYPTLDKDEIDTLQFAIDSIKVDRAYDSDYERVDFIVIPEGATNGDMIKAMFGFQPRKNTCILPKEYCNGNPAECDGCRFDDWWNSPYRKE